MSDEQPKKGRTPTVRTASGKVREVWSVHPDIKAQAGAFRITKKKDTKDQKPAADRPAARHPGKREQ